MWGVVGVGCGWCGVWLGMVQRVPDDSGLVGLKFRSAKFDITGIMIKAVISWMCVYMCACVHM